VRTVIAQTLGGMAATSSKPAEPILLVETVEDYLILLAPGEPFVVKPFTMAELRRKVRAALTARRQSR
jgi:DNA-binding response OmpR family regulator